MSTSDPEFPTAAIKAGTEASPVEEAATTDEPSDGRIAVLEQSLWRNLSAARGSEAIARAWVPIMYAMLDEVQVCAVFLTDPEGGRLRTVASWPASRIAGATLLTAAETAIDQQSGVVRGTLPGETTRARELISIAAPITVDGVTLGAVGIEALPADRQALTEAMRRLQWGAAWIRDALRADQAGRSAARYAHAVSALHVVAATAAETDFETAARAAVTDLAGRYACDRVSIGFRRFGHARIAAISHSAQFGRRMELVRQLGAAMDEAIDQRSVLIYPDFGTDAPLAAHRHEKLARAHGIGHILTCPLFARDHFVGAVLFERPANQPFTQAEAEMLEAAVTVLAPVLEEQRRNDRWLSTKAVEIIGRHFTRLVGPGKVGRKATVLGLAALIAFCWFARGVDRLGATAVVEGAVQRTIAAPFDGFIADSSVRAGDTVTAGEVLVNIDDRELTLERLRLTTLLRRNQLEYDKALAGQDRAEVSLRRNQVEQAEAQIALVDKQLEHTRLLAPFDGLIASGDLSQSIGSAVLRGDALLTMVPSGKFRIVLSVDERRISDVALGQAGSLLVTALPQQPFPIRVVKITPVAVYGQGRTTYRVEAELTGGQSGLQPGMEGVAKIDIAEARLVSIWTRPMLDWARIWSWRWLGMEGW